MLPTKDFDGEDEEDEEEDAPPPPPPKATKASSAKTPRKGRSTTGSRKSSAKTPKAKSRSTSRTTLKEVEEEEEEEAELVELVEPPPTVKKKGRPRTKSIVKTEEIAPVTVEQDEELPVTTKMTRSRSKSTVPSEIPSEDEAPPKPSRSRSKAKSKAVADDPPVEQTDLRKSTRSRKPKSATISVVDELPRKVSRTRSKLQVEDDVAPESSQAKAGAAKSNKRASRPKTKVVTPEPESKVEVEVEVEEEKDEDEEIAPKQLSNISRSQPKSSKSSSKRNPVAEDLFDDDVVMEDYAPPPSDTQDEPASAAEMTSLFVPKRAAKFPSQIGHSAVINTQLEPTVKRQSERSQTKPVSTSSRAQQARDEDHSQSDAPVKAESAEPVIPESKPTSKKTQKKMKIVEISSDEDQEEIIEPRPDPPEPVTPTAAHQDVFGPQTANQGHSSLPKSTIHKPTSTVTESPRISPSPAAVSENVPEPAELIPKALHIEDVIMEHPLDDLPPETHEIGDDLGMKTAPSTPPRPKTPPIPVPVQESIKPMEQLFVPPLARLPFMPMHTLSGAELDMTVEEWIRYQIEVEQDRFKRDGETELEKFRKKAEEVRKVIESL